MVNTIDRKTMDRARALGFAAAEQGMSKTGNPYSGGEKSWLYQAWMAGYQRCEVVYGIDSMISGLGQHAPAQNNERH